MTSRERGGWTWILAGLASSLAAAETTPADGPTLASGVASTLPWWMWFLPVIAVAIPAGIYWWRHRPTPPDTSNPGLPGGPEEPGEAADPLVRDPGHPDLFFAN